MTRQGDWLLAGAAALLLHVGLAVCVGYVLGASERPPAPLFFAGEISLEVEMEEGVRGEATVTMADSRPPPEARTLPASADLPEISPIAPPDPAPASTVPRPAGAPVHAIDPLSLVAPARGSLLSGKRTAEATVSTGPSGGLAGRRQGVRDQPTSLSVIRPRYPYRARAEGQEGSVTLRVRVSAEGRMQAVDVVRCSGFAALDEAALGAVRKAGFVPAERAGQRVDGEIDLTFTFRLKD
jgi:protein TonB